MSIIYCPTCNSETLLAKTDECNTGWKCNKCNKCCLEKEGIPFQNENKEWEEEMKESKEIIKDTFEKEYVQELPETEKRKSISQKGRQMTLFDYLC